MLGRKVRAEVTWHLDLVPGWNDSPSSVIDMLETDLQKISHYRPEVRLIEVEDPDEGTEFVEGLIRKDQDDPKPSNLQNVVDLTQGAKQRKAGY